MLAHDWGSAGMWEYLSRPGASDRSRRSPRCPGPSTDHYAALIRDSLARPYRPIRFLRALDLALRLPYWIPFSIPVLAPAAMRAGLGRRIQHAHARRHPARTSIHHGDYQHRRGKLPEDLPRQHFRAAAMVRPDHYVDAPVQVIVNAKDPYVSAARVRLRIALGPATVAPRHQRRSLVAVVAPTCARTVGARAGRLPRRQAGEPRVCCARRSVVLANTSATHWFP